MHRGRTAGRDLVFDIAPAAVLLAVGLLDVFGGLAVPYGDAPAWTAVAPVVIACLALLLRRRRPLIALGAVLVVVALPDLVTPTRLTYWGEFVPWLVAMYSAGRHLPWQRGVWAIPMTVAGYALTLVAYPLMREPGDVLYNVATLLGLWVLGRFAESWSDYRDRSLLAEFERAQAAAHARERERARIARELHDVISHTITVIVMQAGGARLAAAADPAVARDALARIEALGQTSLGELRTLLAVLGEGGGEDSRESTGSAPAPQPILADIPALCERMRELGLPIQLDFDAAATDLAPLVQLAGYRVVQEGLTNVLKHVGTVPTAVRVHERDELLRVEVANSPGAPGPWGGPVGPHGPRRPHRPRTPRPGAERGLVGMRERVAVLGGVFEATTRDDGGYVIRAELPTRGSLA